MPETVAQRELPEYRREVRERYTRAKGYPPRKKQEILMAELAMWLDIVALNEPDAILRTVGQFVRGPGRYMGWKPQKTAKRDQELYATRIKRGLDYLKEIGWVAERSYVRDARGAGVGILVVAGPCSSTGDAAGLPPRRPGAAPQRRRKTRQARPHVRAGRVRVRLLRDIAAGPRSLSSGELCGPSGGPTTAPYGACGGTENGDRAAPVHTRASRPPTADAVATLEAWLGTAHGGWEPPAGAAMLEALPWLAAMPVVAMARLAFAVAHPSASPVISPRQADRLRSAVRQLDRYADFGAGRAGAGRELVLDLILGDWREHALERRAEGRQRVATPRYVPPKTLGGIAVCARRVAHQWRRGERSRRAARC